MARALSLATRLALYLAAPLKEGRPVRAAVPNTPSARPTSALTTRWGTWTTLRPLADNRCANLQQMGSKHSPY